MADPLCFQGIQEVEAQERCDGCVRFHAVSELVAIGDGSIRVCRACYADATAMVLPSKMPAQSRADSEGSVNLTPSGKRTAFGV